MEFKPELELEMESEMNFRRIGFIVNPIAGMGGRVGLKGTDGVLEEAIRLGALPMAPAKAARALNSLLGLREELVLLTGAGELGERVARELGFEVQVVHEFAGAGTSPLDTIALAKIIVEIGSELILFAGGDGTARNLVEAGVYEAGIPVVGIPAGVKIHSPVFATHPEKAGELAAGVLGRAGAPGLNRGHWREAEVLDISEEDYRSGRVMTKLYGYLKVPNDRGRMQNKKAPSPQSEANAHREIALEIMAQMEPGTAYFVGPGTTTRAVLEALGQPHTLLGVDVVLDGSIICQDASEKDLLAVQANHPCRLIVTPTGGQGFLLGRGNQQLSPEVLRGVGRENLMVIATQEKLAELKNQLLLVDTGDPEVDALLTGYVKVWTGFKTAAMVAIR